MAEPRGPHDPPVWLPPSIPKRLQDEDDVQNWSRWAIRSLARGAIDPATARELMSALQKYLELRWTIQGHRPAPPGPPMRQEDRAELAARTAKFAAVDALADQEDAVLAAAALIPQAVEAEAVEGSLVIDLAQIVAQARAQTAHLHLEKSPARAVEEAPLTAEEQHPEGNASAPRQPAYRPIEVDRPPNLGRELAQEEF